MGSGTGPPAVLPKLEPEDIVETDERVFRIYMTEGTHPTSWRTFRTFGPLIGGRFDHHTPPKGRSSTRSILYGAINAGTEDAISTCLVEVFQATRLIDRHESTPYLAGFDPIRPVRLLDLRLRWLARAGSTQLLNSGPHSRSHRWSRKVYSAYPEIDGLLYPSAVAGIGGANVALYERATDALPRQPEFNVPLTHIALALPLDRPARRFGYLIL